MKTKLSFFIFSALFVLFITTLGTGHLCIKVECGCQFKNNSGTYEISMKNISNENMHAAFSDVLGTGGNWRYSINPCYGFFGSTTCSYVAMCKYDIDHMTQFPVAKPNISMYGEYEEGKPLQVTYEKYNWKGTVRQLVINLNSDGDNGVSKVSQSLTSSNLQQYTVNITSESLRPQLIQPSPKGSPSSSDKSLSIGSILVISFFVIIVIYLVPGMLFMKYNRGATGREVIPNIEFWSSLPGLIKDGCAFFGKKVQNLCNCERREFSELP